MSFRGIGFGAAGRQKRLMASQNRPVKLLPEAGFFLNISESIHGWGRGIDEVVVRPVERDACIAVGTQGTGFVGSGPRTEAE